MATKKAGKTTLGRVEGREVAAFLRFAHALIDVVEKSACRREIVTPSIAGLEALCAHWREGRRMTPRHRARRAA